MKKLLCFTTSLIATVCALSAGGAVAFAETTDKQFYPDTFETVPSFDNLEDYAVGNDGKILFLQNNVIYEYGSANVTPYEGSSKKILHLYFENGEFYYETNDSKLYALTNFNEDDKYEDFTLTTPSSVEFGTFYYFKTDGDYYFLDKSNPAEPSALLNGYDNLKLYNDTVYAVRTTEDNKKVLCTLKGTEKTDVTVEDFETAKSIAVGGAYGALTASAEQDKLKFVNLTDGAYMTEVNLDGLTKETQTFDTGNTVKANVASTPNALLLYFAGDKTQGISIIAVGSKTYLIHPKDTSAKTVYPFRDSKFTEGTATEGYIYSAPYESVGTRIKPLPYGTKVTILKEIKKVDNTELNHDFYYVEYQVDEETKIEGYVRAKLISTFVYNEAPPVETADPEGTYEDLVKPVVLILIVLLLIAIAAGYLIYVGTSDKRKKKNTEIKPDENKH